VTMQSESGTDSHRYGDALTSIANID